MQRASGSAVSAESSSKTKPYQARVWRGGKIVTLGGFAHRLGGGAVHRANAGGADGCCKACSGAAADEGGGAAAGAGGGADAAQGRQHDGLYFGVHHSNAGRSKIYLLLWCVPPSPPELPRRRARSRTAMGVKGLQSYVQNRLPLTEYIVELASLRAGAADTVVVDGMALIRKLYEQSRPRRKTAAQRLRPARPPARPVTARSTLG